MIDYEKLGNVAVITINRPDARNAVNTDVANGIESAIDQMEADDEVWVGILTGARTEKGYIFCAGADLKQMSVDPGGMQTETRRIRRHRHPRADQADHRRGRRPGARRRHRDRARPATSWSRRGPPCSASRR